MDSNSSHMIKNNYKHFDVNYDISDVTKNNHKCFDLEYNMKINYRIHISICFC